MKLVNTIHKLSGRILCPSIELSLTLSLLGGQSFRWKQIGSGPDLLDNRFQGVFKDLVWTLWQDSSHLHFIVHSKNELDEKTVEKILRDYFRLEENLEGLYREWSERDEFFKATCGEFVGIRMLHQDLRENIFSFLCSSNNNIARISSMIDKMCTQYGDLICNLDDEMQTNGSGKGLVESSKGAKDNLEASDKALVGSSKNARDTLESSDNVVNGHNNGTKVTKGVANKKGTKRTFDVESSVRGCKQKASETVSQAENVPRRTTRGCKKLNVIKSEEKLDQSMKTNGTSIANNATKKVQANRKEETGGTEKGSKRSTVQRSSFYSFPSIETLADAAVESKLRELGFGYRAKFIQQSAAYIVKSGGTQWLQKLEMMSYEEARTELMNLQGIGAKVADCICLMSLSHLQSVPVDTHVYQIAVNHYSFAKSTSKTLTPAVYNAIRGFFIERFGPHAGWAHSILFCADLKKFQTKSPEKKATGKKRKVSGLEI